MLENGCAKAQRKMTLSVFKLDKLRQEYDFILDGYMTFGKIDNIDIKELVELEEKIDKTKDFIELASKELNQYSKEEIEEASKVNYASYKRTNRLQKKALEIIQSQRAIFLTLTFNNQVFDNMSKETRKKNITRFLKKTCSSYIANIDYGAKNEREHYHALVVSRDEKIDNKDYAKIFYNSNIDFEKVVVSEAKNSDIEATSKKISKYVNKLTNHAIKETTQQNRIIYSKS